MMLAQRCVCFTNPCINLLFSVIHEFRPKVLELLDLLYFRLRAAHCDCMLIHINRLRMGVVTAQTVFRAQHAMNVEPVFR